MKTLNFLKKRYVALKSGSRRSRRVTGQRNVFNQLHQKYGDDFQKRNNVRILIDGKKQLAILLHSPARGEPYETLKSQCWECGVLQHTTCSACGVGLRVSHEKKKMKKTLSTVGRY